MQELMPNRVQEYQRALSLLSDKLKVCRYSIATHNTYYGMFRNFLKHMYPTPLHQISQNHVQQYHLHLIQEKNISRSYQNQSINALKFYLEKVLGMDRQYITLERPNKEHKLPEVLSLEEVKVLLGAIPNLKHRTMLTTIYSAGLRMGELLNLKPGDIDSSYMKIWVRQGKGVKDRATLLSPVLLELLRGYYKKYKPKNFLFESPEGAKYSGSSVRKVLKRAVKKTNIRKKVVPHTLRHSFATHLMENGTNLRYIQTLLGHTSSRTTEIYTHVSTKKLDEITSPLDLIS